MKTTLEQTWARVGFVEPDFVERLLLRGAVAGALGALVGALAELSARQAWGGSLVAAFAVAPLVMALPRQRPLMLGLLLGALGFALLVLGSSASTVPFVFTVPLGVVLALEPLPAWRRLLVLVGPSLGVAWALQAARWLGARWLGPVAVLHWAPLLATGLFVAAGAALAFVRLSADTIEPRLTPGSKVQQAWVRLRAALGRLPVGPERAELRALAVDGAERWLAARGEVEALLASVDPGQEVESRSAVEALTQKLTETTDDELRGHVNQLLRVHRDTLEQLDGLKRRADRADARAAAEAGWLETAAFTLELAPRGGATRELVSRLRALRA